MNARGQRDTTTAHSLLCRAGGRPRAAVAAVALSLLLLHPAPAAAGAQSEPEPQASLQELLSAHLPKQDLGVLQFLAEHPQADGRGVLVAILDSGVDLDQTGLAQTSTGTPKIIDFFDATDDGLVELAIRAVPAGDTLLGLSGRRLHLGNYTQTAHAFRIGELLAEEFFPWAVRQRLREDAAEETEDDQALLRAFSRAQATGDSGEHYVEEWEQELSAAQPSITWFDLVTVAFPMERFDELVGPLADQAHAGPHSAGAPGRLSARDLTPRWFQVSDAENQGENQAESQEDNSLFWGLLIDTDRDGDLAEEQLLFDYRLRHDVARLAEPAHIAVGANISPDGSRVSLLYDEGGHGTHVAGIVAAFFGEGDPFNGLAPGAQILSIKIGNGKFGGATTHNSIMKGLDYAIRSGAQLVNISFGGSSFLGGGHELICEFINEAVSHTGLLICASAGNAGPALTTVGAPASARGAIAFGAALSPNTMETNYGVIAPRRLDLFGFSSRGPLLGGDLGVDFITPGAALSTLPTWHLARGENWNGTSMAAPQGSGCLALLVSAAMAEGIPYDPARVRRALRQTAHPLPHLLPVEQGAGLIQVADAFRALADLADREVTTFVVEGQGPYGSGGGYYNRNELHQEPFRLSFHVKPDFPEETPARRKADFLKTVNLVSSAPWLSVARQVAISGHGVSITVTLDPRQLTEGLNCGCVRALDVAETSPVSPGNCGAAAEFQIPFTVIRPTHALEPGHATSGEIPFEPGDRASRFIAVPEGASRARLSLQELDSPTPNGYEVAMRLISVGDPRGSRGLSRQITLSRGDEQVLFADALPGTVIEVAIFSRWRQSGPGRLAWNLSFDGLDAAESLIRFSAEEPVAALSLRCALEETDLSFAGTIQHREHPLRLRWNVAPDTTYRPPLLGHPALVAHGVGSIDVAPGEEELTLRWEFTPELDDFLDDAIWRLRNHAGRIVARGHLARREARLNLEAPGRYELRAQIFAPALSWIDPTPGVTARLLHRGSEKPVHVYADPIAAHRDSQDDRLVTRTMERAAARRFGLRIPDYADRERPRWGLLKIEGHGTQGRDAAVRSAPPLHTIPIRIDALLPADTTADAAAEARVWLARAERRLISAAFEEAAAMLTIASGLLQITPEPLIAEPDTSSETPAPVRWMRAHLWLAARPGATVEDLAEAHSLTDRLRAEVQRRTEKQARQATGLLDSPGSPHAAEADLWEARLLILESLALLDAGEKASRAEKTLKEASRIIECLDPAVTEIPDTRDLARVLRAEHALARWSLARAQRARRDRSDKHRDGSDSTFAAVCRETLAEAREILRDPPAFERPHLSRVRRAVVRILTDLGWTDLAGLEIDRWMQEAPAQLTELYTLRKEIADAASSPSVLRWQEFRSHRQAASRRP
jgi:subtilisin family serine protease